MPLSQWDELTRLIEAGGVIRLGEGKDLCAFSCHAFHLQQGLQRIVHPQQEKMAIDDIECVDVVGKPERVTLHQNCRRGVEAALFQCDTIDIQPMKRAQIWQLRKDRSRPAAYL